jgi:hypothetical protein
MVKSKYVRQEGRMDPNCIADQKKDEQDYRVTLLRSRNNNWYSIFLSTIYPKNIQIDEKILELIAHLL